MAHCHTARLLGRFLRREYRSPGTPQPSPEVLRGPPGSWEPLSAAEACSPPPRARPRGCGGVGTGMGFGGEEGFWGVVEG